jgi:glycogen debranching enzyme
MPQPHDEWIETNGLGGYASSTVIGANTRRYHGLLVAATKPPLGRMVLLSKLEETLVVDGRRYDLSVNHYPGATHPNGDRHLREFRRDPFPIWVYQLEGIELEKRAHMARGENTTVVEYELRALDRDPVPECSLELRPLIAFRDYHSMSHANDALERRVALEPGRASVTPYHGAPTLHLHHNADHVESTGNWYYRFQYEVERERGLDYEEDLFNPMALVFHFGRRATARVVASTEARPETVAPPPASRPRTLVESLEAAADQFLVRRGSLKTVIAGYHWFGDWGRDTMIALPGLTLATGKFDVARDILEAFAASISQGMLPNRFPDAGEAPEYNTVDATLWFFEAIRAYAQYTGDFRFVRDSLYAKLREIVDWHMRGTRYGIRVDDDGLLRCGEPGVQLTWMDAKIGDWVVTPRTGKPVEIQALWYNALRTMEDFARQFGDKGPELFAVELATLAKSSFNRQFWNEGAGCLYDVVECGDRDGAVRPNQIFAVSLRHPILEGDRARQVVEVVERDLLTPMGLRSLSPRDSRYRPHYLGGVWERDSAYHQGTVWPWLMGPFLTAYLRVHRHSDAARDRATEWLEGFRAHLDTAGLGQISEIADAEPPFTPRGCIAQAWSVAELLRAAVEDVYAMPQPEASLIAA